MAVDQLHRHRRQLLVTTCCPAIFNRDVLTVDKAFIFEAQAESFCEMRKTLRGLSVQHPHDRDRGLLRVRGERPRCRYSANQDNELAPSHRFPQGTGQGIVST